MKIMCVLELEREGAKRVEGRIVEEFFAARIRLCLKERISFLEEYGFEPFVGAGEYEGAPVEWYEYRFEGTIDDMDRRLYSAGVLVVYNNAQQEPRTWLGALITISALLAVLGGVAYIILKLTEGGGAI